MFPSFQHASLSHSKLVRRLPLELLPCSMKQVEKEGFNLPSLIYIGEIFLPLPLCLLRESGFLDFTKKMIIAFQTLSISLPDVHSLLNLFPLALSSSHVCLSPGVPDVYLIALEKNHFLHF